MFPTPKLIAFVHVTSQMSGVEFSTLYLVRSLNRKHWTPMVICPEEGDLPDRARSAGIEAAIVPGARFFSTSVRTGAITLVNPLALMGDFIALVVSAQTLARFLSSHKPALVVTKGLLAHFYGGLAAQWVGIPCVWHVQDRVSERAGPMFPWTLSLAGRVLAREIIADAESIARQLRLLVRSDRISVIWNGVDLEEFSPDVDGSSVRLEWGAQAGDLLIGVIGRLTPWKGQHVLIQAFRRIAGRFPQARVVLIGSPLFDTSAYADALKCETARLGLKDRVVFAGFRRDLPQVLAAVDVVAHTALEKDSSPLAVVSTMAAGRPIVSTNVDGTAQLFDEGVDGFLVPPGDAQALAEKLEQLLCDANLRLRLGQAARAKAEREFGVGKFAGRCETVFERALQ